MRPVIPLAAAIACTLLSAMPQARLADGHPLRHQAGREPASARSGLGGTPLHWEAFTGTPAGIRALIDAGADTEAMDHRGNTPLHWAAIHGTPANIRALIDGGADIYARDKYHLTALHIAARHGTPANIRALVAANADPDTRGGWLGGTPLHEAVRHGTPANIRALVDAGADINARDKNGNTPLDYARPGEDAAKILPYYEDAKPGEP